jgi:hypothetical protein
MWGELAPPTAPQERLCHGHRFAYPPAAPLPDWAWGTTRKAS